MDYILVPTDGRPQIVFTGERVCGKTESVLVGADDERELTITVYAVFEGGFVADAGLCSADDAENAVRLIERVDTAADVEKFLDLFDPLECAGHEFLTDPDLTQVRRSMTQTYEAMVKAVRAAMQRYCAGHPNCVVTSKTEAPKPANRFWKLIGLK